MCARHLVPIGMTLGTACIGMNIDDTTQGRLLRRRRIFCLVFSLQLCNPFVVFLMSVQQQIAFARYQSNAINE